MDQSIYFIVFKVLNWYIPYARHEPLGDVQQNEGKNWFGKSLMRTFQYIQKLSQT